MGKYMRKAKVSGEVAVMEVSAQSSLGVRTRARTLALQRLQKPSPPDSSSYLELRSRRLEKPLPPAPKEDTAKPNNPTHRTGARETNSGSASLRSDPNSNSKKGSAAAPVEGPVASLDAEVSFGENVLEVEARDRSVRETTPCSLIKDSETIGTPGSTTRPTNSTATNRRMQNSVCRSIPTTHEMEEFFAGAEQLQQRIFTEKYNFDPANDRPLPGRYEWVKLDS
ncbi:cyclin-dependent kinase inhibitor 5-like [Phoenix dactylifera]|uniref:Cyclin-dependent kinase inhibitor 5-like n=1 Tax=Phoenix dactylifera TaxID=42345 RepID=A0A8B7BTK6_PHODC|nr:cyclin-dependent kinase inhibitor 5-like [Phoenix dactylifera]